MRPRSGFGMRPESGLGMRPKSKSEHDNQLTSIPAKVGKSWSKRGRSVEPWVLKRECITSATFLRYCSSVSSCVWVRHNTYWTFVLRGVISIRVAISNINTNIHTQLNTSEVQGTWGKSDRVYWTKQSLQEASAMAETDLMLQACNRIQKTLLTYIIKSIDFSFPLCPNFPLNFNL